MVFTHLSPDERHYIEIELKNETSQNKIVDKPGRAQSSLSRELPGKKAKKAKAVKKAVKKAMIGVFKPLKSL